MLRPDEAVVTESSLSSGFCSLTASERWPGGFQGDTCFEAICTIYLQKKQTQPPPNKTFSNRELTGLWDTLHYPSPLQPTPSPVSEHGSQWQ